MAKRRNKYNAQKVALDGYTFDSQAEGNRYLILRDMLERGEIAALEIHPHFELQPAFIDRDGKRQRAITYIADFRYWKDGKVVVEDVKGGKATQTAVFRLKAKMLRYRYPEFEFIVVEM